MARSVAPTVRGDRAAPRRPRPPLFDQSGLGDAAAELLPKTPAHVGVCLIGGDRSLTHSVQGDRLIVGKSWLIQRLGAAMRSGKLIVAERAPGRDLAALAVIAADLAASRTLKRFETTRSL